VSKLVVIADDIAAVRETLKETIEELFAGAVTRGSLRVETCKNGTDVVSLCATTVPDLIILDVDMPDVDGIETFYKLKESAPAAAAKVVFLTGLAGAGSVGIRVEEALSDGAGGCLPKPITAVDLKNLVGNRLFAA